MKKCPNCNAKLTDDNDFCPNDGGTLVLDTGKQGFSGFQSSGEMPTQFIQQPQNVNAPPTGGSSNVLYLVIGILATALVGVGLYLFLSLYSEKHSDASNTAASKANTINATSPTPPTNVVAANMLPTPNPTLSLNGNWTGEIIYPSGSAFSAKASFADSGNGQVSGQILWTLLRTTNPEKMGLTGSNGTEFVRGTFDPSTRTLSVDGYDKNDPTGKLIILDKYRLTMSADGHRLSGFSYGGKSRGRLNLRK